MDIIKTGKKSKHLYTLEKHRNCKISKDSLHMNDTSTPTTPYSRQYTSFTPDRNTHTASNIIKAGLVEVNVHNIYTHKPLTT
jgi:hypothetical protein